MLFVILFQRFEQERGERGFEKGAWYRDRRTSQSNHNYHNEEEPEWMDAGPDDMTDTIELRGFEDDEFTPEERRRVENGVAKRASPSSFFQGRPNSNEQKFDSLATTGPLADFNVDKFFTEHGNLDANYNLFAGVN